MYMYLVDARGYIISASGPVEPVEELLASHSLDIDGQQNVALQGTEYLVSVDNSTVPKWYFVTLIAPEALNAKTSALNRITILMVLFTLCVGVSMSYILARRQYKPMAQVLRHLGSYSGQDAASNEYDFILSAFRNIKEAQHNIDAFWRQQTATLQKEFLTSALRGQHCRQRRAHGASAGFARSGLWIFCFADQRLWRARWHGSHAGRR